MKVMGNKTTLKIFHCGSHSEESATKMAALVSQSNIKTIILDIREDKFTATRLLQLCNKMKLNLKDIVNTETNFYKENLQNTNLDEADWIRVLIENPNIIKMPIAETDVDAKVILNPREILNLQPIGQDVNGYNHLNENK